MTLRLLTAKTLTLWPVRSDFEALLVGKGYQVHAGHGSGATLLMRPAGNLVWKVGDDPGTRAFAAFLASGVSDRFLPRVFAVTDGTAPYDVMAMERLSPFAGHLAWTAWYDCDYVANRGVPSKDPFCVVPILARLRTEAKARRVGLDVKAINVLLRRGTGELVFFDPFY